MPARGGNAKAESGKAKKAANADKKAAEAAAAAEQKEAARWEDEAGKKGKGKESADAKAEKKAEEARKKAERERLLAEEEAALPDGGKKAAGNDAKKAGKKNSSKQSAPMPPIGGGIDDAITSLSASNIDDAIDALSLVAEKTDKASQGAKAAQLERHPERRFKAAFEAFKDREMARIKQERPGMRSQQYHDALYKEFQKHPDNPFNQQTIAYDATKEEKLAALQSKRAETAKRLADSS